MSAFRSRTEVIDEEIDLSECDGDELVDGLELRGYTVVHTGSGANDGTFGYIEHLAICGQITHARDEALQAVSRLIGRPL